MSGHYVALRLRAFSLCIDLSSLGDMCWSLDGLQPICMEWSSSQKGVWKFDICGEMNPLDIFCIGRSEFVFHLDGEINRDGWHRICTSHILHVLLEMTKPNNNILFVFFEYFDCTENTVRIWIRRVTWKIYIFSISFALVFAGEVHEGIVRRS